MRISKIIVEKIEEVQFLGILLFCDEMLWGFQKSLKKWKISIMYFIIIEDLQKSLLEGKVDVYYGNT